MIHPINNHVLIEPMKYESFIEAQKSTFEEIGIVIDAADNLMTEDVEITTSGTFFYKQSVKLKKGSKVYFDSWLASKFPAEKDGEFYWLVDYKDIKAIDNGNEVSELSMPERSSTQISSSTTTELGNIGTVL